MAENEKSFKERLADLENKIDYLIYSEKTQLEPELSESEFKSFYSMVENEIKNIGGLGGRITMNSRFADILKHKVLYPDYDTGYWYPTGRTTKDLPVDFRQIKYDYAVEMLDAGNFTHLEERAKRGI